MLVTKLDELGKIAWMTITLMALAVAWPLRLAIPACLAGSGSSQPRFAEYAGAPGTWINLLTASQSSRGPLLSGGSATRGRTMQGL